ncbi:MAG: ABC transporter ATP-binding protein [Cytophagales bacterium]|nr:ABC transporter ATP-binding protein [Cytophagales bacterium]
MFYTLLEAQNIVKSYNNIQVLRGISLQVSQGEFISIVGASGAGKSTLLHILSTIDKPDSGIISYHSENVVTYSAKKLAEFRNKHIGFVFQFHNLFPEFSALENICIPAYIGNAPQKQTEAKAMELLEILKLTHRAHHKPGQLSGGEQQRVAVARALINNPKIVYADEPSGNLDAANAEDLHRLFFDLRKQMGQTFIVVTHSDTFANMADKKYVIKEGIIA